MFIIAKHLDFFMYISFGNVKATEFLSLGRIVFARLQEIASPLYELLMHNQILIFCYYFYIYIYVDYMFKFKSLSAIE